ncbi:sulfurtransferase [Thiohalomonas denitrificans]|uniref:sulfurtransferase n=1 Tax=Thiohalomonas denitrificans TaxID=415747 RepID=UPI0026F02D3A
MHRRMLQTFLMAIGLLFVVLASAAEPPAFLVNSDWLEEHIDNSDLVLLEVRYHPHRYYTVGHIPGAVQVQRFKDLGDNFAAPIMRFPSREDFQATLRGWGVNDDSTIVLYDDSRTALASRVYYLLELYGFDMEQVKLLNGSTLEWTAFNDLSKEAVVSEPGSVTLKEADPALYVEWTDVYDDVLSRRDPEVVLLDARPRDMYTGKVIQHAIQGGHIPGAINIVSLEGTDGQSQKWHSPEKLAAMYADIPKDKRVYVYCHDGFRMGLAYMQLKSLGYQDVKLYNGGWSHWGNELTLPVVEGDQPYDEAFAL